MFVWPLQAEEQLPDTEFLEYLGSWKDDDEEWLALLDTEDKELPAESPTQAKAKATSNDKEKTDE